MMTYRILSLDGGGLRGVITARMLQRLNEQRPGWLEHVDLIAGTSTGGILALGLAAGLSPEALTQFYLQDGPDIFAHRGLLGWLPGRWLFRAKYDNQPLLQAFRKRLTPSLQLQDLQKKVLITAFDLDCTDRQNRRRWKAKLFHNFPGIYKDDSDDRLRLVTDVALATSAAPTYFPIANGYIDGGVAINNPSMAALAQTQDCRLEMKPPPLDDIVILSLGTGEVDRFVPQNSAHWGLWSWRHYLIDIMLDSDVNVANFQAGRLLKNRFHRLSPLLEKPYTLDDVEHLEAMLEAANKLDITATLAWLDRHWQPTVIHTS